MPDNTTEHDSSRTQVPPKIEGVSQRISHWYTNLSFIQKGIIWVVAVGSVLLLFIGFNMLMYWFGKSSSGKQLSQKLSSISTPTPTPHPLTSKGTYTFSVTGGEGKIGLIRGGTIKPVDPVMGGTQDIELTVTPGAENIRVVLVTDTKEKNVPLIKDPAKPDVWRESWIMDDTYSYTYTLKVIGTVSGKDITVPIMFR